MPTEAIKLSRKPWVFIYLGLFRISTPGAFPHFYRKTATFYHICNKMSIGTPYFFKNKFFPEIKCAHAASYTFYPITAQFSEFNQKLAENRRKTSYLGIISRFEKIIEKNFVIKWSHD